MSVPLYLRVLWSYKWLLAVGVVVAVLAALVAGFTLKDGQVVSRAETAYRSDTTILLGGGTKNPFQAVAPGQTIQQGTSEAQQNDLTNTAVIYAYLVSGSEIRSQVEAAMGPFQPGEALSAVRRTTQPAGTEQNPGRFSLPILSIVGESTDPDRAVLISETASTIFQQYVGAQQDASGVAPEQRVTLSVTDQGSAVAQPGSNPIIPIAITGLGVFLAFIALAFILYNIRISRERVTANRNSPRRGDSFRRGPALGTGEADGRRQALGTPPEGAAGAGELASSGKRSAT
ncbi:MULTISPECIES: hypothetical protein [unclassified Rathayibacter]|uniref:hypothetical protein n=1 Tax=unclassified Rathayibacter TaxID=2609250 RepID=UPI00188B0AB0|nr:MULTISPECIES: hypothetical protein [unclassified Rathayibacter]MBF4461273.1 hypothetical protein [Rathayibacter sp. VKM Ac-2879]MBF4502684.1 hypothetical protein [Rathayibacter sp. VKM Ac-2878]